MDRKFAAIFCFCLCIHLLNAFPTADDLNPEGQNEEADLKPEEQNEEANHNDEEHEVTEQAAMGEESQTDEIKIEQDATTIPLEEENTEEIANQDSETDVDPIADEVNEEENATVAIEESEGNQENADEVSPEQIIEDEGVAPEETSNQNNETPFQRSSNMNAALTDGSSDDNLKISYFPEDVPEGPKGPQVRIVGGTRVTNREEFAYQVSLRYRSNSHFCGATIIDDKNILTAAHCVYDDNHKLVSANSLLIVVGDLNVQQATEHTVTRVVQHVLPHPKYNYKTFKNDLAVLRIESLGNFTAYVNKIELAQSTPTVGTECVVSGWGKTSFGGSPSYTLLKVNVPTISREICMTGYGDSILDGMLCAGLMQGGKDACQGDSGGPLVCNGQLAGVVSWGYDCALKNYPGVYADVAFYYSWIREQQGKSHAITLNTNISLIILNTFIVILLLVY